MDLLDWKVSVVAKDFISIYLPRQLHTVLPQPFVEKKKKKIKVQWKDKPKHDFRSNLTLH